MRVWRLIPLEVRDAYTNMALDEALLTLRAGGRSPSTIRLYRWRPSAVSIGYFQSVWEEVRLEECRRLGVDVVRRITGGGAVYHDFEGEVTYSVVAGVDEMKELRSLVDAYRLICGGIVAGLRRLGVDAEFRPVNDVLVGGRKVSGNAQTRRRGALLQHGTVLLDLSADRMFGLLKVSEEKIKDKALKDVRERVTSVRGELGRMVSHEELAEALKLGFEEALSVKLEEGRLGEEELRLAHKLAEEKYRSEGWLFWR